ncbi:hypothetical protein TNCV_2288021 [Trichonephila clavipes]|nr:hypothetical protein TNCV_2288021 [Trichonephila clavipes]
MSWKQNEGTVPADAEVHKAFMHYLSTSAMSGDILKKAAGLSYFEKGHIVMVRCLGTSILETMRLVGCQRAAGGRIYQKGMDGHSALIPVESGDYRIIRHYCSDRYHLQLKKFRLG